MPSRTGHPGTRRAHTRKGKPVRSASIRYPQTPKRRLNAAARRRAQSKPMLAGAAGLLGLGALDAILNGRWGGFLVLGGLAVGLTVTHYGWQWHKNRQAQKPAKQAAAANTRRRQARAEVLQREKDAARRAGLEPAVQREMAAARAEKTRAGHQPAQAAPTATATSSSNGSLTYASPPWAKATTATESAPKPRSQFDELVHPDTEASRKFYALRESGYRGPIDQDGNKATTGPEADILRRMAQDRGEKVDW